MEDIPIFLFFFVHGLINSEEVISSAMKFNLVAVIKKHILLRFDKIMAQEICF